MKPLSQLRIDFMGRRNLAFIVSAVMLIVSIGAIVFQQLNLGLDFTGGTLIEVRYGAAPSLDAIRQLLENSGFQDVSVQTFGASTEVLIRLQQAFDGDVGNEVVKLLRANGDSVNLVRAEFVGAQVGDQLRDQSGLGLLVALGVVMLYVALRFQYKFAIGALLALLHDVIIVVGVFALFQLDFDLTVLAAILAVIGYSLNDTIVVYDRIRETIR
ncbi:MAG: protein translocase subunit SecF, partial [Pseudomonadota bacterium]|nr:protein translocase subunit SecF [Pseudomonadota bacterium]